MKGTENFVKVENMRILFTKQLPLDAPGGEANLQLALAKKMSEMGVEVFLMPVTDHPTPGGLWPKDHVIEVRPFGMHKVFDSFSLSKAVADFIKVTPVDVILSWQYETAYLSLFQNTKNLINGMVAVAPFGLLKHKAKFNPIRSIVYHLFHFRQIHKSEIIFCPSNFAKNIITSNFGIPSERVIVTHLYADDIFQPSHNAKTGPVCNFIFSGSFDPIKGVFDAIEALAIVNKRGYTDWNLTLTGWGDDKAVKKLAEKHGIIDHLLFLGNVDKNGLVLELSQADLAILPSHIDNFGLSIAEAQACGLPVVSYRVGGIPEEVMDGKTAILVELNNFSKLADAIIQLINNPEQARLMGVLGQQNIRGKFSLDKTTRQMIKSIEDLLIMKEQKDI